MIPVFKGSIPKLQRLVFTKAYPTMLSGKQMRSLEITSIIPWGLRR